MPLVSVLGNLGAGKTLFCVMVNYYSELPVVSNFRLAYDDRECEVFDLNTFLRAEYENCNIILDEAYNYLESRISQSELNRIMSYILFQSRKKNVTIYLTAQLFSTIDKRYRELSELLVIATKTPRKYVYYLCDHDRVKKMYVGLDKAKEFYNYYDTNEVIFEHDERLEFRLKDSDAKFTDINGIVESVREHYNAMKIKRITKDMVKLYFTLNGLPNFLVSDTYTLLSLGNKKSKAGIDDS